MAEFNKNQPGWAPPPPSNEAPPYSPPQAGWGAPPGQSYTAQPYAGQMPAYGTAQPGQFIIQQQPPQQTVLVLGGCPSCRVGHLEDEFTCCGICCCILFFPLGLICLFAMREKRCINCGASF